MKPIKAREIPTSVEQHLTVEHEGVEYLWVAYFTENVSGYDWYQDGKKIDEPGWAEELDMGDIWYDQYKTDKAPKCEWCNQ